MRCVIVKRSFFVNVRLSTQKKKLVSHLTLTDVEFLSHTFETMKWIALCIDDEATCFLQVSHTRFLYKWIKIAVFFVDNLLLWGWPMLIVSITCMFLVDLHFLIDDLHYLGRWHVFFRPNISIFWTECLIFFFNYLNFFLVENLMQLLNFSINRNQRIS